MVKFETVRVAGFPDRFFVEVDDKFDVHIARRQGGLYVEINDMAGNHIRGMTAWEHESKLSEKAG